MKHIINTGNRDTDIVINTRFNAKTNENDLVYTDDSKTTIVGRNSVENVIIYDQGYDSAGNVNVRKMWLGKHVIIDAYNKIKELEESELTMSVEEYRNTDYLPF